jgi:hypothetical protein
VIKYPEATLAWLQWEPGEMSSKTTMAEAGGQTSEEREARERRKWELGWYMVVAVGLGTLSLVLELVELSSPTCWEKGDQMTCSNGQGEEVPD